MKFNNLMNQKKYTISVPAKIGGVSAAVWAIVGVSAEAWTTSSAGPVAATSASFS